jgi:uracil-DNA glycosylase
MEGINLQEIRDKLYAKLKDNGWGPQTVNFIMTSDFESILSFLLRDAQDGKRFTPPIKHLFRAFETCPFDNVNVVIIGQDPYPQINVADGIAFSCGIQGKIEKSLEYMYKSIQETTGIECTEPSLDRWSSQGVLLLNSALTTTIGKPGTHQLLWRPFLVNVLDALIWNKPDTIYVFLGKKAQEYMDLIPDISCKIAIEHPAAAAYKGAIWNYGDVFNKVNDCLALQNKPKIIW